MILEHMTDDDLMFIDNMLEKYDNDDSISGASELDGFLTAIASSPELIEPSEWLAAIWGSEEKMPNWETVTEANRFTELALKLMNYSAVTLATNPDEFEALFIFDEDGNEGSKIVVYWCAGYMRAVEMREHLWANLPDNEAQFLAQIAMFSSEEHLEIITSLNARRIAEFQDNIEPAACEIYAYWVDQKKLNRPSNVIPFIRSGDKVQRNDPCPCGSGKKYKKCCGDNGEE